MSRWLAALLVTILAGSPVSVAAAQHPRANAGVAAPQKRSTASRPKRAPRLPANPQGIRGRWNLVLNEPFTGPTLDTYIWRPDWFGHGGTTTGPINANELACYSQGNVSLPGDGSLHLVVSAVASNCQGVRRPYTGAVLSTNPSDGRRYGGFQYTYGVVQARVYIPPAGARIADWPAVMTLGQRWPQDGEDDILENVQGTACAHFHSPVNVFAGLGGCDRYLRPGWHTVASDWEPGSVTWYYDGLQVGRVTQGVTSAPMYLVLVDTVSAKAPSIARPSAMRVQYVRVWQHPKPASG